MGSTGVLPFCGTKNIQLILSKKDEKIKTDDAQGNLWSFTITRKNSSDQTRKNSVIEYMIIDGKVPTIDKKYLNILPNKRKAGETYSKPMYSGTYIKLYNYQTRQKTTIKANLVFRLSQLLPELPIDIFLADRREGFDTPSNMMSTTLKGNKTRMKVEGKLYNGFPICNTIKIDNQNIKIEIYLLKNPPKSKNLRAFKSTETIVYLLNGQYHGFEPDSILNRKSISLDYIKKNILVYVDVTEIDLEFRESLFMASRDRMRDSAFKKELLDMVLDEIANSKPLQYINDEVRTSQLKDKTSNNSHIIKSLNKVMKKVSNIASLFDVGEQLNNTNEIKKSKNKKEKFIGVNDPTFFEILNDHSIISPKEVELGKRFRIIYKTDAINELFINEIYNSKYELGNEENIVFNYSLSLNNGLCSVLISLPDTLKEKQIITFNSKVITKSKQFDHQFVVKLIKVNDNKEKQSKKRDPKKENPKLNLPLLNDVYKKNWDEHNFDEKSVLEIKGNDFYINLDNIYLKQHIASSKQPKEQIIEEYKSIFLMQGIAIQRQNSEIINDDKKIDIREMTSALAPITFPTQLILEDLRK